MFNAKNAHELKLAPKQKSKLTKKHIPKRNQRQTNIAHPTFLGQKAPIKVFNLPEQASNKAIIFIIYLI